MVLGVVCIEGYCTICLIAVLYVTSLHTISVYYNYLIIYIYTIYKYSIVWDLNML